MPGTGAVLAVAIAFPSVMTFLYFVVLSGGTGHNPAVQAAVTIGKACQLALPVAAMACLARDRIRVPKWTTRGLGLGLAFGAATGLLILGLFHFLLRGTALLEKTPLEILDKVHDLGVSTPGGFLLLAAGISVGHSLLEEYYWRWFVFDRLRTLVPLTAAVLLSSLGFMAHHVIVLAVYFPGQWWLIVIPFSLAVGVGGAFWAWLYHRSGSIYAPWASHIVVDAALMAVGWDMIGGMLS